MALSIALSLVCVPLLGAGSARVVHEFTGPTMGTRYTVKVVSAPLASGRERVAVAIRERLDQVNGLMSTYRRDSELSRFNRHRERSPFRVSPPTFAVFQVAREVSELTGGAFDVTAAPLVAAWGFGAAGAAAPPSASELADLKARVGYRLVGLDPTAQSLWKESPAVVCDLSALAKGYAVDRVADALADLGFDDFLVEVGGELKARGRNAEGDLWRVAIEAPPPAEFAIHRVVRLQDASVATSGDYRSFYERGGVRLSHLIDPRRGRPIEHAAESVSVIHRDAVRADALATALIVLGPVDGYALALREHLAAYFIVREPGGTLSVLSTPAFEAGVHAEAAGALAR